MSPTKQIAVLFVLGAAATGVYMNWELLAKDAGSSPSNQRTANERAVGVETAPVSLRVIETIVEAVGTTRAVRSVRISPQSSGRIEEVGFRDGQIVKSNAVLLRLDSEIQRADLAEAEARLKEATSAERRSVALKRTSAVSEATVERLVAEMEIAKANRDRAAKQLQERVVRAPFAGSIGFTSVEKGSLVKEGDVIAVLDDLSSVEVEFSVPEGWFGKFKIGNPFQARAAAYKERVFRGTVVAVDTRIDDISRAFKVRGVIANDDLALPAGMFLHVSLVLDGTETISVPEEAVVVEGEKAFVFVAAKLDDSGKARVERREVMLGRRSFGYVEITEGVAVDELVVVRGVQKVRNGSLVQTAAGKRGPAKRPGPAPGSDENGPSPAS